MFMQSCAEWVIPMGEQFKLVRFNADTADRATRRNLVSSSVKTLHSMKILAL